MTEPFGSPLRVGVRNDYSDDMADRLTHRICEGSVARLKVRQRLLLVPRRYKEKLFLS